MILTYIYQQCISITMWHYYVYVLCIHGPCSYIFIYLHFTYDTQRNQKQMFNFTFEASKTAQLCPRHHQNFKDQIFQRLLRLNIFLAPAASWKKITKALQIYEGQKIHSHLLAGWCLKIDWWMARKSFLRPRLPDCRHQKSTSKIRGSPTPKPKYRPFSPINTIGEKKNTSSKSRLGSMLVEFPGVSWVGHEWPGHMLLVDGLLYKLRGLLCGIETKKRCLWKRQLIWNTSFIVYLW